MASALSDDSDIAPSDFPLSSSDDDLLDKTSLTDRCPLCRNPKKYFFCADCIRNGDFYSSHCVQRDTSQRYVEKKMSLLKVKGEIQELLSYSQSTLDKKNKIPLLQQEIRNTKERIQLLQKWKDELNTSFESNQAKLMELKARKIESQHVLISKSMETSQIPGSESNTSTRYQVETNMSHLRDSIQENVKLLLTTIFPITCEGLLTDEEDSDSLANVKNALADASQTAFVRGQWIYSDAGYNGRRYLIAGVVLPGAGDMKAYKVCAEKAEKDGDAEMLRNFKVALSHVTQLTQLLAFYFGLRLPKKIAYLDFIRNDLDSKRFAGRIARLHSNVLYLCTSQGVAPVHLRHTNPLARLYTLLEPNICELGRTGPFEFHPELWCFEDAGEDEGCLVSSSSSDGEDDGDLNADWESVGCLATPEATEENTTRITPSPQTRNVENQVANSVVSVVSGVASLWKAFPWSK